MYKQTHTFLFAAWPKFPENESNFFSSAVHILFLVEYRNLQHKQTNWVHISDFTCRKWIWSSVFESASSSASPLLCSIICWLSRSRSFSVWLRAVLSSPLICSFTSECFFSTVRSSRMKIFSLSSSNACAERYWNDRKCCLTVWPCSLTGHTVRWSNECAIFFFLSHFFIHILFWEHFMVSY